MDIDKLNYITKNLTAIACVVSINNQAVNSIKVAIIKNELSLFIATLKKEHAIIAEQLNLEKEKIFVNGKINLFAFGKVLALLNFLCEMYRRKTENSWFCIHPRIIKSSQKLYLEEHYTESTFRAFLEINDKMKEIYKKLQTDVEDVPDGTNLMNTLLSDKKPIIPSIITIEIIVVITYT